MVEKDDKTLTNHFVRQLCYQLVAQVAVSFIFNVAFQHLKTKIVPFSYRVLFWNKISIIEVQNRYQKLAQNSIFMQYGMKLFGQRFPFVIYPMFLKNNYSMKFEATTQKNNSPLKIPLAQKHSKYFLRNSVLDSCPQYWKLIENHDPKTEPLIRLDLILRQKSILQPMWPNQTQKVRSIRAKAQKSHIIIMEHPYKFHKSNIRYAKISLKKRMKLVKEVLENNQLISKAAKRLNLKLSTAKLIVKRYRQEGSFFEAKAEKLKRLEKQQESNGKIQNTIKTDPPSQNLPQSQEQIPNIEPKNLYMPTVLYFQQYCGTPYPYSLPFMENMMFYPL